MTEPTTIATIGAVKNGIEVLDKIGILERVYLKLANNPDKAALKLTAALSELLLGYTALHNEIVALSNLSFDQPDIKETRTRLIKLKDGRLGAELRGMKGNCRKITNIYNRYLTGWFSAVLRSNEASKLDKLFAEFGEMDGRFIQSAEALSYLAQQTAMELLPMVEEKRINEAEKAVAKLEKQLAPLREKLSRHMQKLWDFQDRFIEVGRAV